jgi:hypothetical protein
VTLPRNELNFAAHVELAFATTIARPLHFGNHRSGKTTDQNPDRLFDYCSCQFIISHLLQFLTISDRRPRVHSGMLLNLEDAKVVCKR